MCGRFELITKFNYLQNVLKGDHPQGLKSKYQTQNLIRPNDPVLVIKNEGKMETTFMSWGFISPWAKNPFDKTIARPFNARSETVEEKNLFKSSWIHKRCLIPASGFFEKGYRIRKKNYSTFWLGGIWSRWSSPDGAEIESCCILTTEANELVSQLHNRMPVIVPNGIEKCPINPSGFQWFSLDKDDPEYVIKESIKAEEKLNFFINEVKSEYNLKNSKICISGFSQGCMMSINLGLTSEEKFNCIVGFSGKIIDKENISKRMKSRPEILLIHGDQDIVVPPSSLLEAQDFLMRHKINIETKMIENCGHHIPIEASSIALNYIKKNLNIK